MPHETSLPDWKWTFGLNSIFLYIYIHTCTHIIINKNILASNPKRLRSLFVDLIKSQLSGLLGVHMIILNKRYIQEKHSDFRDWIYSLFSLYQVNRSHDP